MKVSEFQRLIEDIYGAKDGARGTAGTYMWLAEEVGELSRALRRGDRAELEEEFADVMDAVTVIHTSADIPNDNVSVIAELPAEIVMQLAEGEDLSARIQRGALPLDEVLDGKLSYTSITNEDEEIMS